MNYSFLIALAILLMIAAPFILIGARREGKRRRERTSGKPLSKG